MAQFTVTVDHTKVGADLTDFPLYVLLTDMPAWFWSVVSNGGGDIRTFAADGTTELAREIVSCNTATKTGELHVKCDLRSSTNAVLVIDTDGIRTEPAFTATYGRNAVWSDYYGVYHFNDNFVDSTGNNSDATNHGTTSADGQLGKARAVTAIDQYIDFGYSAASLGITRVASFSIWVKYGYSKDSLQGMISDWSNSEGFTLRYNGGASFSFYVYPQNDRITANGAVYDMWQLLTGVMDTNDMYLYKDRTQLGHRALNADIGAGSTIKLATRGDLRESTLGFYGETRISSKAHSSGRIATEYANQNSPATFYSIASLITDGQIKVWDGAAWTPKTVQMWDGTAWVEKPVQMWDGAAWVLTPA